ncbi:MAG: hypothetical protein LBS87_00935 [Puniceicoccales bacterium]|jgi:hypothetical protein|nr:hypothetical protein [Puniceicoccales bacterium]
MRQRRAITNKDDGPWEIGESQRDMVIGASAAAKILGLDKKFLTEQIKVKRLGIVDVFEGVPRVKLSDGKRMDCSHQKVSEEPRRADMARYDTEQLKLDPECSIRSFCLHLFPNVKYKKGEYSVGSLKGDRPRKTLYVDGETPPSGW